MSKRKTAPDIDTFAVGPSCCKNFTHKDLCHHCVAHGLFSTALCFAKPTGAFMGSSYEQQAQTLGEVISKTIT